MNACSSMMNIEKGRRQMEEKKNTIINLIKEVDNPDIINYLLDFAKDFIAAFNSQKSA